MDIRLNIYDENNRWVGVDYLTEKGKWMHKWVHKGELERGSWRGRAVGENDINWRYESALAEPSSVPQANELLPHVSGSLLLDDQTLADEYEQAMKRYGKDAKQADAYIEGLKDGAKYYRLVSNDR